MGRNNTNHDLEGVIPRSARAQNDDRKSSTAVYNPNIRYMNKLSVVDSLTVPVRQSKPVGRRNNQVSQRIGSSAIIPEMKK